jgi:hypothetical protein
VNIRGVRDLDAQAPRLQALVPSSGLLPTLIDMENIGTHWKTWENIGKHRKSHHDPPCIDHLQAKAIDVHSQLSLMGG